MSGDFIWLALVFTLLLYFLANITDANIHGGSERLHKGGSTESTGTL